MKGGKREGAGRPAAPARPMPISWRPDTQAQRDKWLELGGARWVKRLLDEAQPAPTWLTSVAAELGVASLTEAEARQAGYAPLPTKPVQPASKTSQTLQMQPMESEDGIKGWYINGPDFYCDIDREPGEPYSIFIRHKDGTEGFAELAQPAYDVEAAIKRCGSYRSIPEDVKTKIRAELHALLSSLKPIQPVPLHIP